MTLERLFVGQQTRRRSGQWSGNAPDQAGFKGWWCRLAGASVSRWVRLRQLVLVSASLLLQLLRLAGDRE